MTNNPTTVVLLKQVEKVGWLEGPLGTWRHQDIGTISHSGFVWVVLDHWSSGQAFSEGFSDLDNQIETFDLLSVGTVMLEI